MCGDGGEVWGTGEERGGQSSSEHEGGRRSAIGINRFIIGGSIIWSSCIVRFISGFIGIIRLIIRSFITCSSTTGEDQR